MTQVLTLPKEVAVQILETLFSSGENKGCQLRDNKSLWTFGVGTDETTGNEFFQIIVEQELIIIKE